LVLSIGRKFPRIFFVSIHEGLTGARGKSSPYLIAESIDVEQPRPQAAFCLTWRRDTLGKSGQWWVQQFEMRTPAASAFFAMFDCST
ncbi:MAG: hypothetical protein LW865_03440, partial [Betaproteobacteria bacterium]|nr:hypothetical protein [Betaproteobacteria bacterium]